jgi:hypothetical protein
MRVLAIAHKLFEDALDRREVSQLRFDFVETLPGELACSHVPGAVVQLEKTAGIFECEAERLRALNEADSIDMLG